MLLVPAIDLRHGACVRLYKGDFSKQTVFGDPVEVAEGFAAGGAPMLHLVDLDAARGEGDNRGAIAAIRSAVDIPLEVGGGIRSRKAADELCSIGIERLVLGTAALTDAGFLAQLCKDLPGRVLVGLDHRRVEKDGAVLREVALEGWEKGSGTTLEGALCSIAELDLGGVIVTDIERDGTLRGPDLEGLQHVLSRCEHPVVASGGVSRPDDLVALSRLRSKGRGLFAAIVGRALVGGELLLEEALRACAT